MLIQDPDALALFIRGQRKAKNMTQTEVGAAVGLGQDTISDFENRPAGSKVDTLFKILAAAGFELHVVPSGSPLGGESQWSEKW